MPPTGLEEREMSTFSIAPPTEAVKPNTPPAVPARCDGLCRAMHDTWPLKYAATVAQVSHFNYRVAGHEIGACEWEQIARATIDAFLQFAHHYLTESDTTINAGGQ